MRAPEPDSLRWARIEALFDHAVELNAAERARYLDTECQHDSALRHEVESLLAEHDAEPAFLEAPAAWTPAETEAAGDEPMAMIGAYRLLRVLGRGGMGTVWLAEREAPDFHQQVALKLMIRGMDSDDLIARFRTERQILASLDHPNIARLLDVGATADGRMFLVMEYVDGVPLLDYCDGRRLTVRQRLLLFGSICAAVHHAHRSLIVHRDLKPANILVTPDGVPKLLDFGIAKVLDEQSNLAAHQTRPDLRLLTPEYSSPEQLRGEAVTTACDVYALGVLLYVMLAGCHPFRGETRVALERAILETEPLPPGQVVTAPAAAARSAALPQLRRQLQGDLDTVVLEAMRREPQARYASVLSLADDIDRHLAGLPVRARPATVGYRLRKFVARNRVAVSAATALFIVLAASTAITLDQSARVREQARLVGRERDKALQVRNFLLEMFGTTGPDQATGDSVTARQLLDRRAATLADAYAGDAETRAEMMFVLAEGYEKLGLPTLAEPLARQSLVTRRSQLGAQHGDVAASLDLLGWVLHRLGRTAEADSILREAVSVGRIAFPAGDARLARSLNDLGVVREARGDYDEAAALYRESLAMRRTLSSDEDMGVAVTTSNLAVVLYRNRDLDGAIAAADSALALFRNVLGPDHQRTTVVQSNLAAMQSARGDHEGAAGQHREILERRIRLFGPRHPIAALSMALLANELVVLQQYADAERLLRAALDIQQQADGHHAELVATRRVLGDLLRQGNRHAEAAVHYDSALALTRRIYGDRHADAVALLSRIGQVRETLGRSAEAEAALRQAADLAALTFGAEREQTLGLRLAIVEFLAQKGRHAEATSLLASVDSSIARNTSVSEALRQRARAAAERLRDAPSTADRR